MNKTNHSALTVLALLLFFCLTPQPGLAAFPDFGLESASREVAPLPVEAIATRTTAIQQKIAAVADRIAAAEAMENQAAANRFGASLEDLNFRTSLLRETEIIYQRQLAALTEQGSLQKALAQLEKNATQGTDKTLPQKPPYSLNVYDYYLDQLANSTRQVEVATQALTVDQNELGEANQRLEAAEKKLRALAESTIPGEAAGEWQKLLADGEKGLAEALVSLQLVNRDNHRLGLKLAELKQNIDQQNISWLKANLTFNEAELAGHLAAIEERRAELEQRIDKLLDEQNLAENKWLAAQRQVAPDLVTNGKKLAIDTAYLQAREAWRETYQQVISHNSSMLQLLTREAQLWQRRYGCLKVDTPAFDFQNWRKEARAESEVLSRTMALQQTHQLHVQAKIAALRLQLNKENIDTEVIRQLDSSLQALNKLGERNFEYLTVLQGAFELNQRLIAAIDEHLQEFNFTERLALIRAAVGSIWQYELFAVDNQPVTVGKIISALLILIIGITFAGIFIRLLHRRLQSRLSVSAAAITEKLIYYTSLLVVIFIAMRLVNIPLGAFAFLGGGVAIGVGFGAQKLINNFISGFILMVEQPIRIGDLVQMDTSLGKIEDIGVRSTRVLTFDNVHLLVPNSYFLENNITNWTHNDNMVRGRVTVGVVYGSSTKLVKKQLLEAVAEHGEVLKDPEPYVLFDDFGDNSLVFTLFFWIMVARVIDKKRIESDIRFIVDRLFHEEQLVMAFPQRDVHLDTSRPLEITITKGDAGSIREAASGAAGNI